MTRRGGRAQHFIRGFGDGNVKERMAPNNRKDAIGTDDLFLRNGMLFEQRNQLRRRPKEPEKRQMFAPGRTPASFEAYVGSEQLPSQGGPWQVSAMALLCVMGLLLALFLHLITDASPGDGTKPMYRRSLRRRNEKERKEKVDTWSGDDADNEESASAVPQPMYYPYQPRYKQQEHRHRKPSASGHHEISSGQSPVVINSRPYYHHNVSGSNSFQAPSSRSPNVPSRMTASTAVGHGLEGFATNANSNLGKPQPLSPVSSFASLSQNELTDKEDSTPEKVMELPPPYHSSNSSLFLSPGHEDFVTPKAGPRRRVALHLKDGEIETAVPFSGTAPAAPLPFIPSLDKTASPHPNDPLPRSMEDCNIMRMESGDMTTESEGENDQSPKRAGHSSEEDSHRAYPGHISPLRKSESLPAQPAQMTPPPRGMTPNRAKIEAASVTPGPRHNIVHKRSDLTLATDAARSLQSSIDFEELTLQQVIGGGGFGQVWKATWRGTPVAVKVLTSSAQAEHNSSPLLQEFAAEINLLKGMRHPNICLYMGACLDPPNRAIVTELAANGSLWDALRLPLQAPYIPCDGFSFGEWNTTTPPPAGTWPWPLVKKVACGAARGMTYLHSGTPPVLHRDLKSANLLLDDSYTTKVCDFGLSRLKAQHNSMTGNCGTVQWMAPEVLANQAYAEPADVYSFGIILWELLTRECPYEGQSAIQCALAVLNRDYRPPIPDWCPPELAALITACLVKTPSQRPTFAQIILALDAME